MRGLVLFNLLLSINGIVPNFTSTEICWVAVEMLIKLNQTHVVVEHSSRPDVSSAHLYI